MVNRIREKLMPFSSPRIHGPDNMLGIHSPIPDFLDPWPFDCDPDFTLDFERTMDCVTPNRIMRTAASPEYCERGQGHFEYPPPRKSTHAAIRQTSRAVTGHMPPWMRPPTPEPANGRLNRDSTRLREFVKRGDRKAASPIDDSHFDEFYGLIERRRSPDSLSTRVVTARFSTFIPSTTSVPRRGDKCLLPKLPPPPPRNPKTHFCETDDCGQGFKRKQDLARHRQVHGEGKHVWKCEECDWARLTRKDKMLEHNKKHHGGEARLSKLEAGTRAANLAIDQSPRKRQRRNDVGKSGGRPQW